MTSPPPTKSSRIPAARGLPPWLLALALAVPGQAQSDLIVHSTRPSAYRSLQEALNAAAPGDRILLAEDLVLMAPVTIRRSVTIQSEGSQRRRISVAGESAYRGVPMLKVEALSSGLPLEIRELDLVAFEMSGPAIVLGSVGHVPGEVRLEDVHAFYPALGSGIVYGGTWILDLRTDRLWMRKCTVTAGDMASNYGCIDLSGTDGVSAVRFRGSRLVMEDCNFRAGSALFLRPHPTGCFSGMGIWSRGGGGGTALHADTVATLLTRVVLSDGNGGSLQAGNWFGHTPMPGPAGASVLVGASGLLLSWDTLHETGLMGTVTAAPAPDPLRGPVLQVGDVLAPLTLGGDVRPGGTLVAQVPLFAQSGAVLGMALDFGPSLVPGGATALPAAGPMILEPLHPPDTRLWPIPSVPSLRGVTLAGQLFYLQYGQWATGNFSGAWIGR